MSKPPTWKDIERCNVAQKRAWLLQQCPTQLRGTMELVIDESGLDRSDLMLPTLYLYVQLATLISDKPTLQIFKDTMSLFQRNVQKEISLVRKDMKAGKPVANPQLEQKVDRLAVEIKTLTQVVARLQKSVGSSVVAATPQQTWTDYIRSPQGITSIAGGAVIALLLLLNLIF